jgi:branched-chain amino acid transport system permease protein
LTSVLSPGVLDILNFLIPAFYFSLLALALNMQWGHTGLFNAGIAGFWAVGAYTAAIMVTPLSFASGSYPGHIGGFNQSFLVGALVAMLLTATLGGILTIPILRLRADYFAIATLAFAEIIRLVFNSAESLTGGSLGIVSIPRPFDTVLPLLPGGNIDPGLSDLTLMGLAGLIVILALVVWDYLTRSSWGRVLRGIREDNVATLAAGKHVSSFQLQAMILGSALMGLSGALFAVYQRVVTPDQFQPLDTFTIYVMVILGGSANNRGVIMGAFLFYFLDWISVRLPITYSTDFPYYRLIVIGAILVLLVLYRPEGIFKEKKRTYPPVT